MSSPVPPGMQGQIVTLNSSLIELQEDIQKGYMPDSIMNLYNGCVGEFSVIQGQAQKLGLPPSVMDQFNTIQKELTGIYSNGTFTSDAASEVGKAIDQLNALAPNPPNPP